MTIKVTRNPTDLIRESWSFYFFPSNGKIVLSHYIKGSRESKKHRTYDRQRLVYDSHTKRDSNLSVSEVEIPDDVKQEAIQSIINTLHVVKE